MAPEHHPLPPPALFDERSQGVVGLASIVVALVMEQPGGPEGTEPTLARPHPQAQAPAQVVQLLPGPTAGGAPQGSPGHQLALADQGIVPNMLLHLLLMGPQREEPLVLAVREGSLCGAAAGRDLEVGADRIDGILGH